MKARMIDIKRFTVHDGPGIRTTIFLKGCSLNCRWCHNPESIASTPEIGFIERKCIACRQCAAVCPTGAHRFEDGKHRFNRQRCTACGRCVEACLPEALEFYGRDLSVEDAVKAVLEDKTFYEQSGGGCTVSGGEPLLQAEFCARLFQTLHRHHIHCAIDTAGAVPWKAFEAVLPHTDLFLYDLKHTDDTRHRDYTGQTNAAILANLRRLSEHPAPIEIRIPIVPGFNDQAADIAALGRFLSSLSPLPPVRLLPYHAAISKYAIVAQPDRTAHITPPTPAAIAAIAAQLTPFGLTVLTP